MCIFRKPRRPYRVTVHLDGRHPYLTGNELDYETRDVVLTVPAKSWSDAAKQALEAARTIPRKWSWYVTAISIADEGAQP